MRRLAWLWPFPQQLTLTGPAFPRPRALRFTGHPLSESTRTEFTTAAAILPRDAPNAFSIDARLDPGAAAESFTLDLAPDGAHTTAGGEPGLTYAIQCLIQVASLSDGGLWPALRIRDFPAYRRRSVMIDLGRTVSNPAMLHRLVRIYSRLRFNELHLRLYDDELCGVVFDGLPMGRDNPHALSLRGLADLAAYASEHHVALVPELESWGHAGAITHHLPALRGGDGAFHGSSFLICEATIALMRTMLEQVASTLSRDAAVHFGFDEARWYPGPDMPPSFTPQDLLLRYHRLLREVGDQAGKRLHLRIWADHAGRPLPPEIADDVIVQPWQYWRIHQKKIDATIERYAAGSSRWMMGVGQSLSHYRGAYHATRYFCRRALGCANLEGVTTCQWGWNDWERLLITPFVAAGSAWNPNAPATYNQTDDDESFDRQVFPIMHRWQSTFPDAFPDAIARDRGPLVFQGHYLWGDHHRQPVSPSAAAAGTYGSHDLATQAVMTET